MRLLIIVLLTLASMVFLTHTAQAVPYANAQAKQAKERVISKRQAINAAKSQVKGKILSASLIRSKGPAVYRVKMLVSEKRVRTVFVDGRTGSVIRIN